ncbi:hypothetical protein [uncultured Tenacibaculum sp.]|uniref:hypothetical protein n=1 Tax=uncultured Tenacibaculum sp. TaxID=174713 RepID=UPI002627A5D4|nr:hypothetical protein [uncultured Tenacibaculum sp.]
MLDTIKLYFNCSIVSMANYLELSYHTLSSLSISRRTYSINKLNKLLILEEALALKTEVLDLPHVIDFVTKEKQETKELLEKALKKVKKRWNNQKAILEKEQVKRTTFLRGMHACIVLLQKQTLSVNDIKWISLRKKHLEQNLAKEPYAKILELEAKVVALKSEITKLENQIMVLDK